MPDNRLTSKAATDILTSRTKYHMSPRWTGTFKTSQLVPIYADSTIRPGDTIKLNISQVIRGTTPVFPVMDDAYLSVECFFVKHKHLLSRQMMSPSTNDSINSFKAWIGAQDSLLNMPLPDNDIKLPSLSVLNYAEGYRVGGLADCLGFPPIQQSSTSSYSVNCLKPLAYYSVWNSFFREPNLQSPVTFSIASTGLMTLYGTDAGIVSSESFGHQVLASVCRDHGLFGSCLPWPQRNSDAIYLPLGDSAPVLSADKLVGTYDHAYPKLDGVNPAPLKLVELFTNGNIQWPNVNGRALGMSGSTPEVGYNVTDAQEYYGQKLYPQNLWADLSKATAATVNQVRYAFATQRWFEQLARSGNRYDELVYGMTGVRQSDAYDDRPEYLGGKKIPLTASQVNSTNGASGGALGNVGAFTHASDNDYYFTKSFDDFGTLLIVAFVRVKDTFAQGVAREDTVFDKFDMYWSQFANIGEVPILNKEIFVQGLSADNGVFGYQEAWANYRLKLDQVTGLARPGQAYQYLTYANNFGSLPTLKSFLTGSQAPNVDQTLAVASTTSGLQWIAQFQFDMEFIRQIPMYSIPGYLDHH